MKVLVQRVRSASVRVADTEVAAIGQGAVLFVGVGSGDSEKDARYLARKTKGLRIFDDNEGRMNCALNLLSGSFLAVSQFTLYADCRRGNRPSYTGAADSKIGLMLYECYVEELRRLGCVVKTGVFGEDMLVELQNDGPVTVMLESPDH